MIKVIQPGLFTSVQDGGRIGFRNYGVPKSGVMDKISATFANAILNNNYSDAVLEITLVGPSLVFTENTLFSLTGADISPRLNDLEISNFKAYKVTFGDILSFGKLKKGARAYLAVKGGFQTDIVLNSRSYYTGITSKAFIEKNDALMYHEFDKDTSKNTGKIKADYSFFETPILEVTRGPEFDIFSEEKTGKLILEKFTISNANNRMGYRFNEIVVPHNKSMITSPVLPGTVQLLPSGQLIILMLDAQTTGGYPRILQLTEKSMAILAQKKTGDKIKFKLLS